LISATVAEVAAAVGGSLTDGATGVKRITDVTSDSRLVTPGSLFVALEGTRVDGHDFAAAAISSGAVAVLAAHPIGAPAIVVDDVIWALGRLARFQADQLAHVTVVAITGSVGKTTTKDLLAHLLSRMGPTVAPPGSFNNELGLPLTVLAADDATRYLILEMGARAEGNIAYLCEVAPPTIGVELGVGSAHLGEFGTRDSIARAKAELVAALPHGGVAVLNADDQRVAAMAALTPARVVTFGSSAGAEVHSDGMELDDRDRPSFNLVTPDGSARVKMQLSGSHLVTNALAAATVAWVLGMRTDEVAAGLSSARPESKWRMEIVERPDGVTIVNDAYNASPESMQAALKSVQHMAQGRRTWAILGEMRELGADSAAEHEAIGRLAVRLEFKRLVVVGEQARPMYTAALAEGSVGEEPVFTPDVESASELVLSEIRAGDIVLVKASRAVGLERVATALTQTVDAERAPGDQR
jgi:UDP-N-acetylmuramoyl-tripeptide--D-alanyl-D-alanine ligase